MELTVRGARREGYSAVYPLFEQLWPNKELHSKELQAVFDRGVAGDGDELFCLLQDGKVIGFCAYAIVNNLWHEGRIAYIYAMVVDERQRGKGYGTTLLEHAIESAREKGLKRVELDSGFPREKAHRFYEKSGFEKRAYLFSYIL